MNSFQTLQAAALGLRLVLLELRAREGVLQLPGLAAAAIQARQARRQLALQRLLPALAWAAGEANGRPVGSDPLPLTVRERLPLLAFLASCGRRLRLPERVPVHLLASQLLQQERCALRRAARVEPALERPARDNPPAQALPSLSRSIVRRLKIKTSSLERTLLAATVPKVTSVRLSTLKSTSAAGSVLPWLPWAVIA